MNSGSDRSVVLLMLPVITVHWSKGNELGLVCLLLGDLVSYQKPYHVGLDFFAVAVS